MCVICFCYFKVYFFFNETFPRLLLANGYNDIADILQIFENLVACVCANLYETSVQHSESHYVCWLKR